MTTISDESFRFLTAWAEGLSFEYVEFSLTGLKPFFVNITASPGRVRVELSGPFVFKSNGEKLEGNVTIGEHEVKAWVSRNQFSELTRLGHIEIGRFIISDLKLVDPETDQLSIEVVASDGIQVLKGEEKKPFTLSKGKYDLNLLRHDPKGYEMEALYVNGLTQVYAPLAYWEMQFSSGKFVLAT